MSFEKQPPPQLDALSQRLLAQTPLHFACYTGNGHLLDTLIGNTLLYNNHCGQAAGACVAALISEEDTVNGWTPAHWAAFYGHLSCLMKLNVSQSIVFDTPSHRSNTSPLHLSAQSGSLLCLKWLLQRGSSKNRQDFMGETALHKAAKAGNMDCAVLLVNHGSSLDLKNHRGLTPADLAEESDHIALAQHLRQAAQGGDCCDVTQCEMSPLPFSDLCSSLTIPNCAAGTDLKEETSLFREDQDSRHSYIFMNGEDIHAGSPTETCDMDQSESEILLTNNYADDFKPSWGQKRSFDDIEDDELHCYKRRCFVPASQKSHEERYGDAYNNNIISSYNAVLAMRVEPLIAKVSDSPDIISAIPSIQQSSMMEHQASVMAQQGYDSTFMTTICNAFH